MQKYFNRELSWVKFNARVLDQSTKEDLPLLERLKFLAIYGVNLDEFYMIRVAGLKKLYNKGISKVGDDGMSPIQQLDAIEKMLRRQKKDLEKSFFHLKNLLSQENLFILNYDELNQEDQAKSKDYFIHNLYPMIVPVVIDAIHPFPHFNNLSFGLVIKMQNIKNPQEISFALIRIPRFFPRFVEVRDGVFVTCESIVGEFANLIFEGFKILNWCPFRITRNADFEIQEEEADDFIELLSEGLKARRRGEIVRLQVGRNQDESLLEFLMSHLPKVDVYRYDLPLNLGALWQIVSHPNFAHLLHPYFVPKLPDFLSEEGNLFELLREQDVILFHPYESFDPVVRFIQRASKDPDVLSIKMTLYRVGKNSPIVQALIEAAAHKQVNVLVELKARFDEENNLEWVRALEEAGAHVIYGASGLKVHAKIALILRREQDRIKGYVHVGSGNYNIKSAKTYTDVSLLSSREDLISDAIKFFHALSAGLAKKTCLQSIYMAPAQIKPKILALIDGEREKGEQGKIIMKMNALVDSEIVDALYRASQEGVKIWLIVRGICTLRPRVEGLSSNIRVISLLGRYLEHARIYFFGHGGLYVASADMMPRNLQRRIELLIPIKNPIDSQNLLNFLELQLEDSKGAYELMECGEYQQILGDGFDSQEECQKLNFKEA
ncbi:polyphosphate kinase 1 [Helicobacter pametensis]|uniref:polyphosphate kinase 1 n=1 Tax=Helicobacter pametensis TaxID=95149 RepID=UPI0004B2E80A|nr:polyphosphate kinase 1 [Helicobacter pametensis]